MTQSSLDPNSVFARALEIEDEGRRQDFLRQACGSDATLRAEIEEMLLVRSRADGFMRNPGAFDPTQPGATKVNEKPGGFIGSYKLLQQIGEGGMGTVFMAEQERPVRRKVALKIIKPGMDTGQVIARFEAERQALAMMDHTNIAKVLDAGTTDSGRPYFVMELVHGVPITEYCDANHLTHRERLELFIPVCHALQHAHQKGIIHRDVKPSNILVTLYDDKPVPKVIDFGVAKAVEQRLTEKTLFTQFGTLVGTFEYMSPEQAELNAFGVDTRSDVYSLGVLLYELLTGTTPVEKARLRQAAYDELIRIIKEEEPPRPSVRISTSGTIAKLAAARKTDASKLSALMKGELDWIVMKCLEKDRTRRYDGANALCKDVQRYLAGDAVEACPPSLGYRLQKTLRRHQVAILTAGAFAAVLLIGIVVSTWQAVRATHAERLALAAKEEAVSSQSEAVASRDEAVAARDDAITARNESLAAEEATETTITLLKGVLDKFNPYRQTDGNSNPTIQVVLQEACGELDEKSMDPLVKAKVRRVFGEMFMQLHEYAHGQRQLEKSYVEIDQVKGPKDLETLRALEIYGNALVEGRQSMDDLKLAEQKLQHVLDARVEVQGEGHPDTLRTMAYSLDQAIFYQGGDAFSRMETLRRRALAAALQNPDLGEKHPVTSYVRSQLADALMRSGETKNLNEAVELCDRVIELSKEKYGENDPRTLHTMLAREKVGIEQGRLSETAKQMHKLIQEYDQAGGSKNSPASMNVPYDWLALTSLMAGDEALELADEATQWLLQYGPDEYGPGHPLVRRYHGFRAWYLVDAKKYAEAEAEAKQVFSVRFAALDKLAGGWDDSVRKRGYEVLAACILRRQPRDKITVEEFQQAEEHLQKATEVLSKMPQHLGSPSPTRVAWHVQNLRLWSELYEKWGKPELAASYQEKLKQWNR